MKLYYEDGEIDWTQWDSAASEPFHILTETDNVGARIQETFKAWTGGQVTLGYDHDALGGRFQEKHLSVSRWNTDVTFWNTAPWLLVSQSVRPSEELEIIPSAGARWNESRFFGGEPGAQAGIVGKSGRTEVHAYYARAFNTPGAYAVVLYQQWNRGSQWKDLEAEILDHIEVGVTQGITDRLRIGLTWFHDDVDDALRFVPPPPPPPAFANIGDSTATGPELMVEASPVESLKLFAGSTYTHTTPDEVPYVPEWTATGGVAWSPIKPLTLHADLEWVDSRLVLNPRYSSTGIRVKEYFLLNAKADWRLNPHVLLFVAGDNLLDQDYEFRPGYPMPGASALAGIELQL